MPMRTHYCGDVNERLVGSTVEVAGWVSRRRDHGGVIFVDLRDRDGLLQVVFDPDAADVFAEAERLRGEWVIKVTGTVRPRPAGTANANLASGQVELLARGIEVLNRSEPIPFQLDEEVKEETRLKYRYIDLRRDVMQKRLRQRHAITRSMREYLDGNGFIDVETPMLTKATPEGARDYLVPSRTQPGKFFALPQSPQIFKQLLMMSGFDRYYQIVRCFRDEDLRADRQPEFTQLDIETSFLTRDDIMGLMEALVRKLFRDVLGQSLPEPFPRMTYAEAMRRYRRPTSPTCASRSSSSTSPTWSVTANSRCSPDRRPMRKAASPRCACRAAVKSCRASRSTITPRSSRAMARRAWRTSRSTTRRRAVMACSRRSSSSCPTTQSPA